MHIRCFSEKPEGRQLRAAGTSVPSQVFLSGCLFLYANLLFLLNSTGEQLRFNELNCQEFIEDSLTQRH